MRKRSCKVKRVIKEGGRGKMKRNINFATISANNRYASFGPETANIFRR